MTQAGDQDREAPRRSLFIESLHAHALRFTRPLAPAYDDGAGQRLLMTFFIVAIVLFLAMRRAADMIGVSGLPTTNLAFVATLAVAFFLTQSDTVRLPIADVGLRRFADWTLRERLYLLQVAPAAIVVFAIVFRGHLLGLLDRHGAAGFLAFSLLTGLLWGMVQEFFYRGWLQTELTRRFGAIAGLLAANVVFTFGPLHVDYLVAPGGVQWAGLAAVFVIGLFFGLVYQRSGNLWIPAILHGLWPPNMS